MVVRTYLKPYKNMYVRTYILDIMYVRYNPTDEVHGMDDKPATGAKYSERFLLRLIPGTVERIKRAAYGHYPDHISASEWVRKLVEHELTKNSAPPEAGRKAGKKKGGAA